MKTGEWKLDDGHLVYLQKFNQHRVYDGILIGCPTDKTNVYLIERILEQEKQRYDEHSAAPPIILFPPNETTPSEAWLSHHQTSISGTPALLPQICCVGYFRSLTPSREKKDISHMVIVWFQEDFALPLAPEIEEQLIGLNWFDLATSYNEG